MNRSCQTQYVCSLRSAHDAVVHSLPKDATTDDIFDIFLSIISQNSHASRNHASLPFAAVTCVREDIETTQYDHIGASRDDFMLLLDYNLKVSAIVTTSYMLSTISYSRLYRRRRSLRMPRISGDCDINSFSWKAEAVSSEIVIVGMTRTPPARRNTWPYRI